MRAGKEFGLSSTDIVYTHNTVQIIFMGKMSLIGSTMSQLRIFVLISIASVALLGCSAKENSELTAAQEEAVAERIAPVGHVVKAGQVVAVVAGGGAERAGASGTQKQCTRGLKRGRERARRGRRERLRWPRRRGRREGSSRVGRVHRRDARVW